MVISRKKYIFNFLQLMGAVFLIFIFAATLGESAVDLVLSMSDKSVEKSLTAQIVFWVGAVIFTAIWALVWVWFKKSEKVCVEYLIKKTESGF